jgi:hypothetical protein
MPVLAHLPHLFNNATYRGTSGSFSSCATYVSTTRVSKPNSSCRWH